jgi:hypothetical protein
MPNKPALRIGTVLCLACLGLAPARAAGTFDGTYKGVQRVTRTNNSEQCNALAKDNLAVVVRDNHFKRGWYETVLDVGVAADGSFHESARFTIGKGRQAVVQIDGRIAGNVLEADIGTEGCAAHMALTKS